jgi:hypothetical protein
MSRSSEPGTTLVPVVTRNMSKLPVRASVTLRRAAPDVAASEQTSVSSPSTVE